MVAIATFYVVFAFDHGIGELHQSLIAVGFALLAVIGARYSAWFIVVALVGHGLFDATVHLVVPDPSPEWWSPFCIIVDIIFGLWLASLILKGRINGT